MAVRHPLINIPHKQWPREVWTRFQRTFGFGRRDVPDEVRQFVSEALGSALDQANGLELENYLEIERSLERAIYNIATPFVVVAADGSGDYTSIKDAIDALPTNTTAGAYSGVVLVKNSATMYDDTGEGVIDMSNKQVMLLGLSRDSLIERTEGSILTTQTRWNFDGMKGNTNAHFYAQGINFVGNVITTAAMYDVTFDRCVFTSSISDLASPATFMQINQCVAAQSGSLFTSTGINIVSFRATDSNLGPAVATGKTVDLSNSQWRFENCLLTWSVATMTFIGTSGSPRLEILGCRIGSNQTTGITVSASTAVIIITGCTTQVGLAGGITFTFSGSGSNSLLLDNNFGSAYPIVVSYSSPVSVAIFGSYASLSLSCRAVVNAYLGGGSTYLTLNSGASGCLINVVGATSASAHAYTIASGANNNLILYGNLASISGTHTDSGTNNSINSLPPSGAAGGDLTGTYPSPTFDLTKAHTWTAEQQAPDLVATGLTGATAASRYVGATASGAPASGTFAVGDFVVDQTGTFWICTTAGSPGSWSKPTSTPTAPSNVVFTANGTFTKASYPGLRAVRVRVQAGGGGSGGIPATGAGQAAEAGGGGGGAYAEAIVAATSLGTNETVTVGAGGTAGASGTGTGGTGGTSSFGSFASAAGGVGGNAMTATSGNNNTAGGVGGTPSAGDIQVPGGQGGVGRVLGGVGVHFGGVGGSAIMAAAQFSAASSHLAGTTGNNYGGGAAGGINGASQTALTGVAGGAGIVVVELIY